MRANRNVIRLAGGSETPPRATVGADVSFWRVRNKPPSPRPEIHAALLYHMQDSQPCAVLAAGHRRSESVWTKRKPMNIRSFFVIGMLAVAVSAPGYGQPAD